MPDFTPPQQGDHQHPLDGMFTLALVVEHPTALTKLDEITSYIATRYGLRFTTKQKQALKCLLINFFNNNLHDLMISRDANDYKASLKRYNKSGQGYNVFRNLFTKLSDGQEGAIYYRYTPPPRAQPEFCSVIGLSVELKSYLEGFRSSISRHIQDRTELIELRYKRSKRAPELIDYLDNDLSNQSRATLKHYNNYIKRKDIRLPLPPEIGHQLSTSDQGALQALSRKPALKRVFNTQERSSALQTIPLRGGRLYGGSWQGIPSRLRKYLTIDGEPTIECDYRALAVNILYLKATGAPFSEYPYDDITIPGSGYVVPRDILKSIFVVGINNCTWKGLIGAVNEQISREHRQELNHQGVRTPDIVQLILERHEAIAHYFPKPRRPLEDSIGMQVQYEDSAIMMNILHQCLQDNIPALPIHDACIVKERDKEYIKTLMISELLSYYGYTGPYQEDLIIKIES